MSVKFYLSDYVNRMGESPIRVSVCIHGQRFVSTVGLSVHPANWVNDPSLPVSKGRWVRADTVNSSGASALRINNRLRRVVRHFEEWESSAPDYPDKELLRLRLLYALGKKRMPKPGDAAREEPRYLIGAYDEYLKSRPQTRQWAPGTLKAHRTLRDHLVTGFGSRTLDFFDEDGLNAFIHYLRYDRKMKESTIRKLFTSFKSFLNWAYEKHYTKVDSIRFYNPRFVLYDKPVIHLDKEEYKNGTRHDTVFPKYALIGTHTGRKTFICFALSNGVPPDVVMKFTGHCDYKSMKPYIDITEDAKKDAIKKMEAAFRKK